MKEDVLFWLDQQAIFRRLLKNGIYDVNVYDGLWNECHVTNAKKLADMAEIEVTINNRDDKDFPFVAYFMYKGMKVFSIHQKEEDIEND
jgi:hypothetical protein